MTGPLANEINPTKFYLNRVRGFDSVGGSNFWLSHKKEKSPLTQGLNFLSACDDEFVELFSVIVFHKREAFSACYLQKMQAVDKWIRGDCLSKDEINWICEIGNVWKQSQAQLSGFGEFKEALNLVLGMA